MNLRTRALALLPGLLVLLGVLGTAPAHAADDDFAFRGTYLRTADNGCDAGDLPTFGGHYSATGDPLLHWNPTMNGSHGSWESLAGETLYQDVICLDFTHNVAWRIVEAQWTPGTDTGAEATCPLGESLVAGGFYFPSGLQGSTTANAPNGSRAWGVEGGGDPRASNTAYAVCGKLPAGFTTYAAEAGRHDAGDVTAHCKDGDLPLSGGWDGAQIRASHPEVAGWTVEVGDGGGFARAVCLTGVGKRVQQRITTGSHPYLNAECADGEFAVNAGWETGAGMQSLRVFLPWNDTTKGWTIASTDGDSSSALAWVLCGKVLPPPAPSWTESRLPVAGVLGLAGLLGAGALIAGRGRLTGPVRAVVGTVGTLAVVGAVVVALVPIDRVGVTPPADSDAIALPSGTPSPSASPTASPTPSPSASASVSASTSPSASASVSPSPSVRTTSAAPKPSPKKTSASSQPAPAPAPVVDVRVAPTSWSRDCGGSTGDQLTAIAVTVDNTRSTTSASWSGTVLAKDGQNWASLSPASGSVAAGGSQTFQIVPNGNACNWVYLHGTLANGYKTGTFSIRVDHPGGPTTITGTVRFKWIQ